LRALRPTAALSESQPRLQCRPLHLSLSQCRFRPRPQVFLAAAWVAGWAVLPSRQSHSRRCTSRSLQHRWPRRRPMPWPPKRTRAKPSHRRPAHRTGLLCRINSSTTCLVSPLSDTTTAQPGSRTIRTATATATVVATTATLFTATVRAVLLSWARRRPPAPARFRVRVLLTSPCTCTLPQAPCRLMPPQLEARAPFPDPFLHPAPPSAHLQAAPTQQRRVASASASVSATLPQLAWPPAPAPVPVRPQVPTQAVFLTQ